MATEVTPDDELMERLRALGGAADPVPEAVLLAGRSAIAHRDLDLRLAELMDEELAAGVRGDAEPGFTFEVDDVLIELAIQRRSDAQHLVGQVDGATIRQVSVRHGDTETTTPVDDLGRFSTPIQHGPLRVEFTLADSRRVATSWIVAPPR